MADMKETVGQRVRRLREERGLSQEDIGERTGLGLRIIARIEAGTPPGDFLLSIAEALGTTPEYLHGGVEGSKTDPSEVIGQYAKARFQNPEVREGFKVYAGFRPGDKGGWKGADLPMVEASFFRSDPSICEMECFYLPKDGNGQIL